MTAESGEPRFARETLALALALTPADRLPPLPAARDVTPQTLAFLARQPRVVLPAGWREALAARGWLLATRNESIAFFERPGYWLRLYHHGGARWSAGVDPNDHRVPRHELGAAAFNPMPAALLAPAVVGKGARARALDAARALWDAHSGYLRDLGIELTSVGVRQWIGSGHGGSLQRRSYGRRDLAYDSPMAEKPSISPAEQARRADAVREARASVALEGYMSRPLYESIDQDFVAGRLTLPEYLHACARAAAQAH